MSDHITSYNRKTIISFDKEYTGAIVIQNLDFTIIGPKACEYCQCTSVDLQNSNILRIEGGAFLHARQLKTIKLPSSLEYSKLLFLLNYSYVHRR